MLRVIEVGQDTPDEGVSVGITIPGNVPVTHVVTSVRNQLQIFCGRYVLIIRAVQKDEEGLPGFLVTGNLYMPGANPPEAEQAPASIAITREVQGHKVIDVRVCRHYVSVVLDGAVLTLDRDGDIAAAMVISGPERLEEIRQTISEKTPIPYVQGKRGDA